MNCPDEGTLRNHIDGELDAAGKAQLDSHLEACPLCRTRQLKIRNTAGEVLSAFKLIGANQAAVIDPAAALTAFRGRVAESPAPPSHWWDNLHAWWKPLGGALAASALIAVLFSFAPARSWGQKILDMLRVEKVAVVPIDLSASDMDSKDGRTAGKLLAQMISDNLVVTMKPGEPQAVPDAETASRDAGFKVRGLSGLGVPQKVLVQGEAAFHTTLNRERIEDLLGQVGRSDIQIAPSVDGGTVAIHIPKLVRLVYGNCPTRRPQGPAETKLRAGDSPNGDCISFIQVPSPVVSVPPTLNLGALAEAGLQVAGMSAAEAHAFCQTVDWSSTLVIPVPRRDSTFRTVSVDGVNATLIETAPHGRIRGEYALIWIKNRIVYSLDGIGSADRALAAAQALD